GSPCDLVLNFKKKKDTVCRSTGVIVGDTASGGTNPYVYSWTPSKGLSATNSATPFAMPDSTTMYYDTVTDAKGCVALDSVKVVVGQIPVMIAGSDILLCPGSSVKIGKAAKNGTPPYKYSWQPASGLDSVNIATPKASPQSTTRYYVTVTDAYGCQTQDSILITVFPQVFAHAGNDVIICRGDSAIIGMDATGGVPPYTYQWNPSSTLSAGNIVSPEASPNATTTYFVTVTDSDGCTNTGSVIVTVNQPPQLNAADTVNQTICTGTSTVIGGTPTSGTPPYTYQWSPPSGLDSINVASPVASPNVTTTYTVIVTDSNGCQSIGKVTVFVDSIQAPQIHISGPSTFCEGDSVLLDAGGPFASYKWSTGETKEKIIVKKSGIYTVTVTDTTGCSATSTPITVTVNQKPSPVVAITGSLSFCVGDSVILTAPPGYSSYLWSDGETTKGIIVKKPGTYFVTVTNVNGCSGASAPVAVTVGSSLVPVITGSLGFCPGDSTMLDAGIGYDSYQWSTGATTETITVKTPGSYSVTVTKGACAGTSQDVTVSVYPVPDAFITASGPLIFCTGDSVMLSAPNGFAAYLWSDGETTQNIVVKASGTYTVTVTAAGGCTGTSAPIAVTVGSTLVPVITGEPAFCPGDSVVLDAGSGYDTYQWNTGATTETIVVKTSGTYSVSVTKGSCVGTSANYTVTEYPQPTASITTASGDTLIASPAATYQWSFNGVPIPGATQQRYVTLQPGSYTVNVTDANGCAASSPAYIKTAGVADICADLSASTVEPRGSLTARINLGEEIIPQIDSLVFDFNYNIQAMELDSIVSSPCSVSTEYIGAGVVRVRLEACSAPLQAGALCTAVFTPLVSSRDTFYTQLSVNNIEIYPLSDSITGTGCSVSFTVLPLCGLTGVIYTGSTTLAQNYPNPFTNATTIHVTLSQGDANNARLKVYNMLGEQIADLTNQLSANGDVIFNAGVNKAGVYYYVLQTASGRIARQMFVVK
ncbi:MAG TPA: T9SS type A sorting domain-containing protein, partial [Candidatus Kapabacteria bacterium]|nr:T9SS type A sorting domain-containing protein [Candidatus Kapabacteria bacterium]